MIKGIHDLTLRQFADRLGTVTAHSKPIAETSHLKGRQNQVATVQQAIYAAGRHVFIFGERGVGKTSLAKTAGLASVENSKDFKQLGCSSETTFDSLMRQVIQTFAPEQLAKKSVKRGLGISKVVQASRQREETYAAVEELSVPWVADVLASLDDDGRKTVRVIVIDEVDRVISEDARRDFAELVKLLGDRGATITFIFTGVGTDIQAILGHHPSSFRQFAQIELHRMELQPALDIVDDALSLFQLDWEREPTRTARFRIAAIANGFPYYVHLLTEKVLYAVYDDRDATSLELPHLQQAIASAVTDAQEEIRKPYDKATRARADQYKLVVWALADSWDLERSTTQIFQSFSVLCDRVGREPLSQAKVVQVLASLKRASHGPLLVKGFRHGMYRFSENIVRGYVRLCALAEDVELNDLSPRDDRQVVHATARERRYIDPRRAGAAPAGFGR